MPIIWTKPDGTVRIMTLSERFLAAHRLTGEPTADAVLRLAEVERAKNPALADAVPTLLDAARMPTTRTERKSWRFVSGDIVIERSIL